MSFGGRTEAWRRRAGRYRVRWMPDRGRARALPYDTPIAGYRVGTCNTAAPVEAPRPCESFDFEAFNVGDYYRAVEEKIASENLTKVLYPNDEPAAGKQLRLEQQYFFVSCSLQDMLRIHLRVQRHPRRHASPSKFAIQLNDTHPAIAVAELMRLLVDEHGLDWEPAWEITRRDLRRTRTTRCCPRRSRRGRCRCSARSCRGTSRSSTRSTGASSTRCARRYPGDDGACGAAVADRRDGEQARAHGPPRHASGSHAHQRRRRAAHRAAEARRAARLPRAVAASGSATRPTASRRAASSRSPTRRWPQLITERHRRRLGDATSTSCASSSRSPTTPAFRAAWRAVKRGRQGSAWPRRGRPRRGVDVDPDCAVRRAGQAHPRVQAPAPERAARHHAATSASSASPSARRPAAHVHLRAARPRRATRWPS